MGNTRLMLQHMLVKLIAQIFKTQIQLRWIFTSNHKRETQSTLNFHAQITSVTSRLRVIKHSSRKINHDRDAFMPSVSPTNANILLFGLLITDASLDHPTVNLRGTQTKCSTLSPIKVIVTCLEICWLISSVTKFARSPFQEWQ